MASIGENIRRLRIERGMSQEDLAKAINKSRSAISQYETDVNIPRMGVVEDLVKVFLVSKSEILGDARPMIDLSYDERQLLDLFRRMDKSDRETLLNTASRFAVFAGMSNEMNDTDTESSLD